MGFQLQPAILTTFQLQPAILTTFQLQPAIRTTCPQVVSRAPVLRRDLSGPE